MNEGSKPKKSFDWSIALAAAILTYLVGTHVTSMIKENNKRTLIQIDQLLQAKRR